MRSRGFTLIEILVVIAIIGVLSSVVLSSLNTAREKGRLSAGKQMDASTLHALGDQLEGEWNFEEPSGAVAQDTSGNGRDGTISGATRIAGVAGNALSFDGVSNKVSGTAQVPVGTQMTVSAWVLKNASTAQKSFFSNRNGGSVYIGLLASRVFVFDNGGTPSSITSGLGAVQFGRWQHIVVTSDGSVLRIYVDGALISTTNQTRTGSTGSLGIGWDPSLATEFWDGSIDNVHVYSRALLSSEVQRLYAEELPRHLASLI